MALKHMERHSVSLVMNCKLKPLRSMFLSIRLAKIKTLENINLVKRWKKSHIAGGSTDQNNLCVTLFLLLKIFYKIFKK